MAVVALVDGVFTLNGVDLSDHVKSAQLDIQGAELDASTIADDWDVAAMGRKSFSLKVEFLDDFAASKTDATMSAAFFAGSGVSFTLKPTSGTVSSTNPQYQGTVLPSQSPVGGGAGELLAKSVTLKGTGAIARGTA